MRPVGRIIQRGLILRGAAFIPAIGCILCLAILGLKITATLPGESRVSSAQTIHLGRVDAGGITNVEFELRNPHDSQIYLGMPKTSCTCTVSSIGKRSLAPGEATQLNATIRHSNSERDFRQNLIVPVKNFAPLSFSVTGHTRSPWGLTQVEQSAGAHGITGGIMVSNFSRSSRLRVTVVECDSPTRQSLATRDLEVAPQESELIQMQFTSKPTYVQCLLAMQVGQGPTRYERVDLAYNN